MLSDPSPVRSGRPPPDPDRHLQVDGLRTDLRGRTVRSGFIQLGNQLVLLALAVGSTMVLARMLTPADYGLLAMVAPFVLLAGTFRDFGLPMATVQRESLDHSQVNALFWLSLRINVAIVLLLAASAPAVAWFYHEPQLVHLTLAMAAGVLVLGLGAQHVALLMRQMRFGSLALIEIAATLAGIAAGIGAAWMGVGYWALALQQLAFGVTRTGGAWWTCRWRPRWKGATGIGRTPGVRALVSYGAHYAGFQLLARAGRSLDRVLVGYFAGASALGLYANAHRWAHAPAEQVFSPLMGVAVSGLSRKQDDAEGYRAACRAGFLPVLAVVMPTWAFMAVEAREVIHVLLGERWLEAVPIFRLLCIASFVGSAGRLTTLLLLSRGDTKRQFRWALVYMPVMALAVGIGVQWGLLGAAVGVAAATTLLSYPRLAFSLESSPFTAGDLLGLAARPALASLAAAAALLAVDLLLPDLRSPIGELARSGAVFGLAYVLVWAASPGGRQAAVDVLGLVRGIRKGGVRIRAALVSPPAE